MAMPAVTWMCCMETGQEAITWIYTQPDSITQQHPLGPWLPTFDEDLPMELDFSPRVKIPVLLVWQNLACILVIVTNKPLC